MQTQIPSLVLVSDRHRCRPHALLDAIDLAVSAGVGAVQLREKDLDARALYDLALQCRQITAHRCMLIVNSRLDIALAVRADGVHLPELGLPALAARQVAPDGFIIGCSVHSSAAAEAAQVAGADYVELGTVFATESKPGLEPAGLQLVRETVAVLSIPCIGIGGIDPDNAGSVIDAGATGVAVVSAILQAEDVRAAVEGLKDAIRTGAPTASRAKARRQ